MKKTFTLSDNEYEVMGVFWQEGKPLSKADIVSLSTHKNWKESSVYILLNSLIKKGAIEEAGFFKSQTNYGRVFVPTLSETEYTVMQINENTKKRKLSVPALVMGMINSETDPSVIKELEDIIQSKINKM